MARRAAPKAPVTLKNKGTWIFLPNTALKAFTTPWLCPRPPWNRILFPIFFWPTTRFR